MWAQTSPNLQLAIRALRRWVVRKTPARRRRTPKKGGARHVPVETSSTVKRYTARTSPPPTGSTRGIVPLQRTTHPSTAELGVLASRLKSHVKIHVRGLLSTFRRVALLRSYFTRHVTLSESDRTLDTCCCQEVRSTHRSVSLLEKLSKNVVNLRRAKNFLGMPTGCGRR